MGNAPIPFHDGPVTGCLQHDHAWSEREDVKLGPFIHKIPVTLIEENDIELLSKGFRTIPA